MERVAMLGPPQGVMGFILADDGDSSPLAPATAWLSSHGLLRAHTATRAPASAQASAETGEDSPTTSRRCHHRYAARERPPDTPRSPPGHTMRRTVACADNRPQYVQPRCARAGSPYGPVVQAMCRFASASSSGPRCGMTKSSASISPDGSCELTAWSRAMISPA